MLYGLDTKGYNGMIGSRHQQKKTSVCWKLQNAWWTFLWNWKNLFLPMKMNMTLIAIVQYLCMVHLFPIKPTAHQNAVHEKKSITRVKIERVPMN